MKPDDMLHADMLDILFENRNKSYGAYTLRRFYNQRLLISFGAMCSLVMLFTALYLLFQSSPYILRPPMGPDVHLIDCPTQPPVMPDLPPARPAAPHSPATIQSVTPVIVPDQQVPKPMATVEEINTTAIGLTTNPGGPDNGDPNPTGNRSAGAGTIITDSTDNSPEVREHAEVMPEFPGGLEALKRYLVKNLRMPENDLDPGARGREVCRSRRWNGAGY